MDSRNIILLLNCHLKSTFDYSAGIFAYLNYLTPKTRREILDHLIAGLKRQEYRGYDSAGVAFDTIDGKNMMLVRRSGKVDVLVEAITESMFSN